MPKRKDVTCLDFLARMGNFLSFLVFFFSFHRHSFHRIWKILFLKNFVRLWVVSVSERFWLEWSLEYQGVCIMPEAAISPWQLLQFTLQLFQGNKTKNNSHSTCKCSRDLIQTDLLSFSEVFIFSFPSKVIIIVIEFMLLDINMFYVLHRAHNPPLDARAKTLTSLSRAQNIVIPVNVNYIVLI